MTFSHLGERFQTTLDSVGFAIPLEFCTLCGIGHFIPRYHLTIPTMNILGICMHVVCTVRCLFFPGKSSQSPESYHPADRIYGEGTRFEILVPPGKHWYALTALGRQETHLTIQSSYLNRSPGEDNTVRVQVLPSAMCNGRHAGF